MGASQGTGCFSDSSKTATRLGGHRLRLREHINMKRVELLAKKGWRLAAVFIIFGVAGPEILVYAEGMALLEMIGAATFVFMYIVGAKLYVRNVWDWFFNFENRYHFFYPSFSMIRILPGMLYYSIPRRTIFYAVFFLLALFLLFGYRAG